MPFPTNPKITTAEDALKVIKPGDHIFIHSVAAAPLHLIRALVARADELSNIEIYHLHTEGEAPYADEKYRNVFHTNCFFIAHNMRNAIAEGRASYIPVFLSEIPLLIRRKIVPINVALINVSPIDAHGFCSLGTSVDATKAAVETADIIIAQVNKFMPRTHGDAQLHRRQITHFVEYDEPIPEMKSDEIDNVSMQIGKNVASLVENGATLQLGIGNIPNAVLAQLEHHKDLGIHTEMFSDGLLPLVYKGIITGNYKRKHKNKIVSSFINGTRALYDFVNDNPMVSMLECSYVNDASVIRQNPKVTAINSAVEIDLTGQICADSIGTRMYSGVGGQMDFIRGASLSEGGKAIIAMPSVTSNGISRIVPYLKEGAGVVTTRANVHYVISEYGIAYLYGKTLVQRANELIKIAHPKHREFLDKMAFERFKHS
jgi:4-hydroxybutyrate CoA-transferase